MLILCFSDAVLAKNLGTVGSVYEIKEKDILSWIEHRLLELQKSGEFKKREEEMKERAKAYVQRPAPVPGVYRTTQPRRFKYDASVVAPYDLKDAKGKIFHHKGDKVNPLETFALDRPLVFLNADDETQLNWALQFEKANQPEPIIILVQGPVFELMEKLKRPLYFDQGGWLIKKFGIQQVPAKVFQEEQHLIIEEVKID